MTCSYQYTDMCTCPCTGDNPLDRWTICPRHTGKTCVECNFIAAQIACDAHPLRNPMPIRIHSVHTEQPRCNDQIDITNHGIVKCDHVVGHDGDHGNAAGWGWTQELEQVKEVDTLKDLLREWMFDNHYSPESMADLMDRTQAAVGYEDGCRQCGSALPCEHD